MRNILLILFLLAAGVFTNKSSAQAVILRADTLEVPCISNDTFLVPIYLDNFTNVSGLQFTLQWDTLRLDFAYVTMVNPQFSGAGFDTTAATIALGKLTFAWTDLTGLSLPPNTVLFKVAFRRIGGPPAPISFVNDPTSIAVFDNQFNELQAETHNGLIKAMDNIVPMITCPASIVTGGSGPTAIPNIAPVLSDNCGTPAAGWSTAGATFANFPNDPDASGALFNIGFSTVTYKATDGGGNTATCSFDILIEFSITTNDLTLIANPNNLASCGETVTIDVLAFNFDTIAGLQFSMEWLPANLEFVSISNTNAALGIGLNNFNLDSTGVGLFSFAWTSPSPSTGSSLPPADVLFTLTYNVLGSGTVAFGNNPTQAFAFIAPLFEETTLITFGATISVIDTMPPSINCPADITVQALGATPVQGIAPASVIDNCAAPLVGWSVSGATNGSFPNDGDASGGLFNIGTSTVTYTTTDAGNLSASCSFNVTVEFANNTTDLTIIANSVNAACGGSFGVDFSVFNFTLVAGLQFTVTWDPALYQYNSVSNFNLPIGIGAANFNIDSVGVGFVTFAWTGDPNGVSLNNTDVIFSLNFNLLNNISSGILIGDDPTSRFAFQGGTFDQIPLMTVDGLVTVDDNEPPTIICPTPAPVDAPAGQLFATVNGLEPTTLTDNCGGTPGLTYVQSVATTNSGSGNANGDYNAGTTTVVYTATDANGNTATCAFQVVVNADTPVVLQLDTVDLGCQGVPTQVTVHLTVENFNNIIGLQFGVNWDTSVIKLVPPVSLQYLLGGPNPIFVNNGGSLTFFGAEPSWPDVPDGEAILTLTFDVWDVNGLANTILSFFAPFDALDPNFESVPVQTINGGFLFSLDNVPPALICPADTVIDAVPQMCVGNFTPIQPNVTDACGMVSNISVVYSPPGNIFLANAPTTLTYTATDDSGNSASCSYTVTVIPHIPPQVTGCPTGPVFGDANTFCQANVCWTPPTFQAECGQGMDTIINDYDPCGLFSFGTTLVNYTATDEHGNVTTCSFEVVVRDVTPPSVICPTDTVITLASGCSSTFVYSLGATDYCDSDLTLICSDSSGTVFTGMTSVICAVLDDAGNVANCAFVVSIADNTPPFINGCPANINVVSANGNCGANPVWQAPDVMDNCDQSVTLTPSKASGSFFDVPNSPHTVTYTATDDLGNTSTCTFTVTVADSTKPVLTNCPGLPIVKVLPVDSCTVTLFWTPPTVSDNCSGVTLTSNLNPGSFPTGDTMVVYIATDASGNTVSCFFNISVKDLVPPMINCPTTQIPVPIPSPCGVAPVWIFPTATDNCTPVADLIFTSSYMPGDTFPAGTTTFIVSVEDASGLTDNCSITVDNDVTQSFSNIPDTIFVDQCQTAATWPALVPEGFCPPVIIEIEPLTSGSVFPFGATTVTYTATDSIGNTAVATFVVVVSEDVPPVINCPVSPIMVNVGGGIVSDPSDFLSSTDTTAGCDGVELNFNLPNATDNCVTPSVTLLQGLASGSVFPLGFNNLVFRAVDSSGNFSQCAIFIEVTALPELRPVVNPAGCLGDTLTITATDISGAIYTWVGPITSSTNVVTINGLSSQNDGQYIVTANVNGCIVGPDTAVVFLTAAPMAENDLTFTINPGETIIFPTVLSNDLLSPLFDFEICDTSALEGLMMNTSDGTFTYTAGEEPGMVSFFYVVCSKTCDLEDQAVVTITINDTKCIFIPNIITPNGDGTNDWFTIPCVDTGLFSGNSLVVYSQWGDKVFEASPYSNDPAQAWRGTLNGEDGKDLPDGVYFYIFKSGPNVPPMKGFVEIFR